MVVLKNILVTTDFSAPAGAALAYGRDLAKSYGAKLHLLHVVDDIVMRYASEAVMAMPDLQTELADKARCELESRLTDHDRTALKAVAQVVTSANVAAAICRYAKDNGIDLIVAGTRGRGAVSHLLTGSVAERVVRSAGCPVLTVHSQERDFIVPDAATLSVAV